MSEQERNFKKFVSPASNILIIKTLYEKQEKSKLFKSFFGESLKYLFLCQSYFPEVFFDSF